MAEELYLGLDTSNYKTSAALTDEKGNIIFERSELLDVKKGRLGLRQSEAFYQHSMRLPGYAEDIIRNASSVNGARLAAVGVSERPRRQEGSYMPCFNAGVNTALILGSALGIPVYRFSHQEGHAAAILENGGIQPPSKCIFMHLSGGTTEALLCIPDQAGYDMEIAGGTKDISFGQLLDRFGAALGMPFPSGRLLDELACSGDASASENILPPVRITDGYFNLSGAETRLLRFAEGCSSAGGPSVCSASAETFRYIADMLIHESVYLSEKFRIKDIYIAGGVASSRALRSIISSPVNDINIHFGDPVLSGDNAVGISHLCRRIHKIRS